MLGLALASPAACSLVTSLDGLGCDAGCDASVDVLTPDAGGSDAQDAAPSPDGSLDGSSFCANAPAGAFCDDFDESPFGVLWGGASMSDGGSVAPSDASWVSAPLSALAQLPANAPVCSAAELYKQFLTVSVLEYDFELNVPAGFPGAFVTVASGRFGDTSCIYRFVPSGPSGAYVHEELVLPDGGVPFSHHNLPSALPTDQWIHVVLSLDFTAHKLAVTTNGITVLQNDPIQGACGPSGTVQVSVGLDCVPPSSTTVVARYDNVIIEAM